MVSRLNLNKLVNELVMGRQHEKLAHSQANVDDVLGALEKTASSSNEAFSEISKIAADTIRMLRQKSEGLEKSAEVKELLEDMINRGMVQSDDIEKKAGELAQKTPKELDIAREAVKLASSSDIESSLFEQDAATGSAQNGPRGMFDEVMYK